MAQPATYEQRSAIREALKRLTCDRSPTGFDGDIEFVERADGTFKALRLTPASLIWDGPRRPTTFPDHKSAWHVARMMRAAFGFLIKIDTVPTPPDKLAEWREDLQTMRANQVILNGNLYSILPDPADFDTLTRAEMKAQGLGSGGREFRLQRIKDGWTVVTHNLWSSGAIPHELRAEFPDTVVQIKGGE